MLPAALCQQRRQHLGDNHSDDTCRCLLPALPRSQQHPASGLQNCHELLQPPMLRMSASYRRCLQIACSRQFLSLQTLCCRCLRM